MRKLKQGHSAEKELRNMTHSQSPYNDTNRQRKMKGAKGSDSGVEGKQ